jgi:probable F420-dependent oxidoreductase
MNMTVRPFRFGVSLLSGGTPAAWQSKVQRAADLGYDIVQVPDHLGMSAPFPALVSAASVPGPRLGTFVLNAGFYRPALLARDVAETSRLLEGRLELGIGTGYNAAEFEEAGLPFGNASQRIDHLEHTLAELRRLVDPMPPLMLGASGKRMLRLAARAADIVGFTVVTAEGDPEQVLADRCAHRVRRPGGGDPAAVPREVRLDVLRRARNEHARLREGNRASALTTTCWWCRMRYAGSGN